MHAEFVWKIWKTTWRTRGRRKKPVEKRTVDLIKKTETTKTSLWTQVVMKVWYINWKPWHSGGSNAVSKSFSQSVRFRFQLFVESGFHINEQLTVLKPEQKHQNMALTAKTLCDCEPWGVYRHRKVSWKWQKTSRSHSGGPQFKFRTAIEENGNGLWGQQTQQWQNKNILIHTEARLH